VTFNMNYVMPRLLGLLLIAAMAVESLTLSVKKGVTWHILLMYGL